MSAPGLPELAGRSDGVFVGRPSLRLLTAVIAATSPLRGWCGKEIGQSGDARNLVRRGGLIGKSVAAVAGRGLSLLDGRPAVIVDSSRLVTQSADHRCHGASQARDQRRDGS